MTVTLKPSIDGNETPKKSIAVMGSPKYEPSRRITSFHIRGFQYWDGPLVLNELKVGDALDLIPEPDNPEDPYAIAIYAKGTKLGYVPREENGLLSLMFFYGHANLFEVRILQVSTENAPWEQVRVGIYVKDGR